MSRHHRVMLWGFFNIPCDHRIPDPEAVKPEDWDEDAPPKIEDPDAVKPDGWMDDGPEYVPDPDATMPEDWYVLWWGRKSVG